MLKVQRRGSRIAWSTASSDNEIGEERSMSDGPQRKTREEEESSRCFHNVRYHWAPSLEPTDRIRRADVGNAGMVEARAGRPVGMNAGVLHSSGTLK